MRIGIIGAGNVGRALGKRWLAAGHEVLFSYSRDPKKLTDLANTAGRGASAGTPKEAVKFGEVVVFAPPWTAADDALRQAGSLERKILVDTTNPLTADLSGLSIGHTTSAAEEIARRAQGARVVKAFNTTGAPNMANPNYAGKPLTMLFCGDDPDAKRIVGNLIQDIGFEPVDAGSLAVARWLEALAMLWIHLAIRGGFGTDFAFQLIRR